MAYKVLCYPPRTLRACDCGSWPRAWVLPRGTWGTAPNEPRLGFLALTLGDGISLS